MQVKICPDCNHINPTEAWNCSQCGRTLAEKTVVELSSIDLTKIDNNEQINDNDNPDESNVMDSGEFHSTSDKEVYLESRIWFDDLFEFFWVPYKQFILGKEPNYFFLESVNQYDKLLGLMFLNGIVPIIILVLIYGATPYSPPVLKDLIYLPFDIGWFILISTSFLINSMAHLLVFRAFSGRGNFITHAFLNALSSTATVLVTILALIILFILRIKGIDLWVMIIGGIYLSIAAFMSLSRLHKLSNMKTLAAVIVSGISSLPFVIGNIWLFSKLREYRPFQFDDWSLWIGGILLLTIAIAILIYIRQEINLISDYPNGVPIGLTIQNLSSGKSLRLLLALSGFLIVLSLGLNFYPHPVGEFVIEDDSILHLNMIVTDADYSASLNRIAMLEEGKRQLYLLDPTTKEINSIELPSIGKSIAVGEDGSRAVVATPFEIVYLNLETGQITQQFPTNYRETDVAIYDGRIYALSGQARDHLSRLEVINISTGDRQEYKELLQISHFIKLQPHHHFLYGYAKGYSALVKIDISKIEPSVLYEKNGFSDLENIWFIKSGEFIITSDADVFSTSSAQELDMKFITRLGDFTVLLSGAAYRNSSAEIIVAAKDSLYIFDSETFENKREIPLPEFQVDIWRENWPFVVYRTYESYGRFLFCNENSHQCYTIVQAHTSTSLKDDYGFVISDIN